LHILLAAVAETENDVAIEFSRPNDFDISLRLKRLSSATKGLMDMIDTSRRAMTVFASIAAAIVLIAPPAYAQGPTDAQRAAIKSQCRSDYMAHCASVPPGGAPALQCLQKNMASLSGGCQSAVRAVEASVEKPAAKTETKTESKPEAAPAAAATAPPAAEPPATAAAKPAAKPAVAPAANATTTTKPAAGAATAAAPVAAPLSLRPMRPREVLFVVRSACGADVRALCAGVDPGGGRIVECLATQAASLSPDCRSVLGRFAAR
jgi:hypothetical protein